MYKNYEFRGSPHSENEVSKILTIDWLHRKQKEWPLVPLEDFHYFDFIEDPAEKLLVVRGTPEYKQKIGNINEAQEILYTYFPALDTILHKHQGKIIAAGGAVSRALTRKYGSSGLQDIDIFFCGVEEKEAEEILYDCIATIVSNSEKIDGYYEDGYQVGNKIRVQHHLNVTNVIDIDKGITYQFIHRLYPRVDMVIGGFDIGACMVFYDGVNIYGTYMGAWSMTKRSICVDTTRRSTSYEYRLRKYQLLEFAIIFPGLREDSIKKEFKKHNDKYHEAFHKLEVFLDQKAKELGFFYYDECGASLQNRYYSPEYFYRCGGDGIIRINEGYWDIDGRKQMQDVNNYKKYSDYCSTSLFDIHVPSANEKFLRHNNLEAVFTHTSFHPKENYQKVKEAVVDLYKNPEIDLPEIDKATIYDELAISLHKYREKIILKHEFIKIWAEKGLKFTGKWDPSVSSEIDGSILFDIADCFAKRISENKIKCEELLKGIKWIKQDVQRQWTSSINPIIKDPKEFYGDLYVPLQIGLPKEVEIHLRIFWHRGGFGNMPKDVLRMILQLSAEIYHFDEKTPDEKVSVNVSDSSRDDSWESEPENELYPSSEDESE